ncbi:MAG: methyltransferase [bacterium]
MFSIETFYQEYETEPHEVVINGRTFTMLLPKYLNRFLNSDNMFHDFPLWAKIWRASWVLAANLAEMPVKHEKHFLEIGGGLGLVSIVATSFGHKITMTECNSDALQFARANAYLNNCLDFPIVKLDWSNPQLKGKYDYIVASEVVYKEQDFPLLLKLFETYLRPEGRIILASEMRKTICDFYRYRQAVFNIIIEKKSLGSENEETQVILFKMTFQNEGDQSLFKSRF